MYVCMYVCHSIPSHRDSVFYRVLHVSAGEGRSIRPYVICMHVCDVIGFGQEERPALSAQVVRHPTMVHTHPTLAAIPAPLTHTYHIYHFPMRLIGLALT